MTEELKIKIQVDDSNAKQKLNEMSDSFNGVSEGASNASGGFTIFKGALADLVSTGIKAALSSIKELSTSVVELGKDFEYSMSEVQAISGATDEEFAELEETARKFGETTVFSASECAQALKYMSLAGWDSNQSIAGLEGVLDLAAASGMDLAKASDMVTDYISAFGLEAEDATKVADLLSYAQSNANTTAEQLGEAYNNCAANMNAAGQDIETTTSMLSMLANQGKKGAEAGTALSAIMRDITDKMENGSIAIGNTTVQVQDANGNFRDMTDILKDVEKATEGLGTAEQATALSTTFTSRSLSAMNMLLNAGADECANFEDELSSSAGTAKKTADIMNDNLSGSLKTMKSAFEEAGLEAYELFEGTLKDGVTYITRTVIPRLKDFLRVLKEKGTIEKFGNAIKKLAEKILPLLEDGLLLLADAMDFVVDHSELFIAALGGISGVLITQKATAIAGSIKAFGQMAGSILGLTTGTETLTAATTGANTAFGALGATLLSNPIGLVVTGIAAATAGIIALCIACGTLDQDFSNLTEEQKEFIKTQQDTAQSMQETRDALAETTSEIMGQSDHTKELADELMFLCDASGEVKDADKDRAQFILNELNDALGTEYTMNGNLIEGYEELKNSIYDVIEAQEAEALLNANRDAYDAAIANINDLRDAEALAAADYEAAQQARCNAQANYEKTLDDYQNHVFGVTENDVVNALKQIEATQNACDEKREAYNQLVEDVDKANQDIQTYESATTAAMEGNYDLACELLQGESEAHHEFTENLEDETAAQLDLLSQQAEDAAKAARDYKTNYENGVEGFTEEGLKELEDAAEQARKDYNEMAKTAYNSGKETGTNLEDGMKTGINDNKKKTSDAAKTAGQEAYNKLKSYNSSTTSVGENFIQGFIDGVNNKSGPLATVVQNSAAQAIRSMKGTLGIKSPSKVTLQFGKYFGEGFEIGIKAKTDDVVKASEKLSKATIAPIEQGFKIKDISKSISTGFDFSASIAKPIEVNNDTLLSGLSSILSNNSTPIILNVDGKTFAETSINTINSLTRQSGKLALNVI